MKNIKFILWNLLAAIVVVVGLVFALLRWLEVYTDHGVEIVVPSIEGMSREDAQRVLEASGLEFVVVDSTYNRQQELGVVLEQNPHAGSMAKHGRAVYTVVNAKTRRMVVMPDLHDVSSRQAQATLQSMQIKVSEIRYEPSEFKDLVLDVLYNDQTVEAGDKLEEGSSVVLIIGFGKGVETVYAPDLRGKRLSEARQALLSQYLILGSVNYDEKTVDDPNDFVVYWQSIAPQTRIQEGTSIHVRMTRSLEKAVTSGSEKDEEDFF